MSLPNERPDAQSLSSSPVKRGVCERLPRTHRLTKRRDFTRVQRMGARGTNQALTVVIVDGRTRLGLTVSKKVGNAVVRNLVKRRVREIMRKDKTQWLRQDVVVIANPDAALLDFHELEIALRHALDAAKKRWHEQRTRARKPKVTT
jgi:ribonuclease P protein component